MNDLKFTPSQDLQALLERVRTMASAGGFDVYVVGGTVRDLLLGRPLHDLDLAIHRDAMAFGRDLADALSGHFVPLDDLHEIARVVLVDPVGEVRQIDIALLQGTLDEDLQRRDFTVDALAVRLGDSQVIDVCGGLADLSARVVRMNGASVLEEDSLRLLRGPRIASELGFTIEAGTAATIRQLAPSLLRTALERQRDELARIVALDDAHAGLRLLDDLGLLDVVLPEVTLGRGVTQAVDWHAFDVFEHGMHTVGAMDALCVNPALLEGERAPMQDGFWVHFGWYADELRAYLAQELSEGRPRASLLKLAALLHDVGKPATRTVDEDGRVRFLGHATAGAGLARKIMRRLRFSTAEVRFVSALVAEHLRPVQLAQNGEVPSRRALYRFQRDLGYDVPGVLLLALADAAAARGPAMTSEAWSRHVAYMNSLLVRSIEVEGIVSRPALLTGNDVMSEFGLSAGPEIGRLLTALHEAHAIGKIADRAGAIAFLGRMLARTEVPRAEDS
jgi:putative nucleotidyltransferase with HDIG domain